MYSVLCDCIFSAELCLLLCSCRQPVQLISNSDEGVLPLSATSSSVRDESGVHMSDINDDTELSFYEEEASRSLSSARQDDEVSTQDSMSSLRSSSSTRPSRREKMTCHSCFLLAMFVLQGIGIILFFIAGDWLYYTIKYNVSSFHKEIFLWFMLVWLPLSMVLCCLGSCMEVINAWK